MSTQTVKDSLVIRTGMFVLLNLVFISGCATRGNVAMLETQLRLQEDRIYSMKNDLDQKDQDLETARREVRTLQAQLSTKTQTVAYPEQTHVMAVAEGVRFNKLRTGGLDEDGQDGDDVLSAVLTPYDGSDELVKLPGEVEFRLYDLTRPKGEQNLGQWKFGPQETSDHWHKSFLASGYLFKLPWQQIPTTEELTLVARFKSPDGRTFQTNQIVTIEPPKERGQLSQVSYNKARSGLTSTRSEEVSQEETQDQNQTIQRVNKVAPKPMLNLAPEEDDEFKINLVEPIPTSTSLKKYEPVKYH